MEQYIKYLIEDILNVKRQKKSLEDLCSKESSIEDHFEEVERWLAHEDHGHDFSYYCGLTKDQFPDAHLLSSKQIEQVMKAFNELLFTWNLHMDIPESVPQPKAYSLLISMLERKVMISDFGFTNFDFCSGYAPECELKEYCPCLKFWKENN